jgi:hypothetical protein
VTDHPGSQAGPEVPSKLVTLGRAGAAKRPSRPDSYGHERTPKPQVSLAVHWSLDRPKLAYKDEVIPASCRALRALANDAGDRRGPAFLDAGWCRRDRRVHQGR